MPLSHSLAYLRQFLSRNGFDSEASGSPGHALTSAALLVTFMGAASLMTAGAGNAAEISDLSFGTELPNMLFKVGFVGSLFGAASQRKIMIERAENVARTMHEGLSNQSKRFFEALTAAASRNRRNDSMDELNTHDPGICAVDSTLINSASRPPFSPLSSSLHRHQEQQHSQIQIVQKPIIKQDISDSLQTPNPYEHLPSENAADELQIDVVNFRSGVTTLPQEGPVEQVVRKIPSGCVGAYFQAVRRATNRTTEIVKNSRKRKFLALPDQQQVSTTFIDACCSDDSLPIVMDLVQTRGTIDVDGFYVGSDGTETCALHASAFHGATKVLDFLCRGIDECDPSQDGGLCSGNLRDANGWTAVHFAAGANSVEAVRILAENGTDLSIEAANGYTPLQWAQRLQNEEVAAELRARLGTEREKNGWISSQPLSMIAHRFFSIIPTS